MGDCADDDSTGYTRVFLGLAQNLTTLPTPSGAVSIGNGVNGIISTVTIPPTASFMWRKNPKPTIFNLVSAIVY